MTRPLPKVQTQHRSFASWIDAHIKQNPDKKTFYRFVNGQWQGVTLKDHQQAINQALWLFQEMGLVKGDTILIVAANSYEWQLLEHASLVYGLAISSLEPFMSEARVLEVVRAIHVKAIFIDSGSWSFNGFQNPALTSLKIFDVKNWPAFVEKHKSKTSASVSLQSSVGPDYRAAYVFTSGTTGEPRTLAYTHAQLLITIEQLTVDFRPRNEKTDRITLCWLPLANLFQRVYNMCGFFLNYEIYFLSNPKEVMTAIQQVRPTVLIGVPKFFEMLYFGFDNAQSKIPVVLRPFLTPFLLYFFKHKFGGRLQYFISGSAKCPYSILDFFELKLRMPIYESYGCSENIMPITINTQHAHKKNSVGKVVKTNNVQISPEGEILVAGPGVFHGYLNATDSKVDAQGFYHTGDTGYFDEEGFLYIEGRLNEVVKLSSGRKINLSYVERVFLGLPNLEHAYCAAENRSHPMLIAIFRSSPDEEQLAILKSEVKSRNQKLSPLWKVKGVVILVMDDDIRKKLFTANMKFRRNHANKHFQAVIDEAYTHLNAARPNMALVSSQGFWFSV